LPTLERRAEPDQSRQYSPQGQPGNQVQNFNPNQRQAAPQLVQQPPQQQQPSPAPFTLTPQEEAQLDSVLAAWEKKKDHGHSIAVKRWEYVHISQAGTDRTHRNIDWGF
jgi:hypothetical protein